MGVTDCVNAAGELRRWRGPVATNQMQAVQLAQFTLMPSFMLSGFMFPFRGMPVWAQGLGEVFPTTQGPAHERGWRPPARSMR